MTKKLTHEEKKKRKDVRKQQKAKSTTVKTITQPKPTEPPASDQAPPPPVNLCDDCAYEFGECEGVPKFAQEEGSDDRVVECAAFVNVAKMPTADQGKKEPPGPAAAEGEARVCDIEHLGNYPDCFRDCPKDECDGKPVAQPSQEEEGAVEEEAVEGETAEERAAREADLEARRQKTQRFYKEEDFGTCQSCGQPLKRTAFNRERDAVRCVNGRCNQYRFIIKTISTGV